MGTVTNGKSYFSSMTRVESDSILSASYYWSSIMDEYSAVNRECMRKRELCYGTVYDVMQMKK